MTRSEFWEWMGTCPDKTWFIVDDDRPQIKILFFADENPEDDEDIDPPDWSEGAVDPDSKYSDFKE